MTRVEVAAVLHRLAAAYRAEITPAIAEIWADHLEPLEQALAFVATDRLIADVDGFFPTIAKFRETYRAEQRARDSKVPALPVPQTDRSEEARARMHAAMQETKRLMRRRRDGSRASETAQ